jgi:hypothetical protein
MAESAFRDKVKSESEPPIKVYTQADLVRSLTEMRAMLVLAGKRIKQQSIGRRDDELLKKMRQVYTEARGIGRQFEKQADANSPDIASKHKRQDGLKLANYKSRIRPH